MPARSTPRRVRGRCRAVRATACPVRYRTATVTSAGRPNRTTPSTDTLMVGSDGSKTAIRVTSAAPPSVNRAVTRSGTVPEAPLITASAGSTVSPAIVGASARGPCAPSRTHRASTSNSGSSGPNLRPPPCGTCAVAFRSTRLRSGAILLIRRPADDATISRQSAAGSWPRSDRKNPPLPWRLPWQVPALHPAFDSTAITSRSKAADTAAGVIGIAGSAACVAVGAHVRSTATESATTPTGGRSSPSRTPHARIQEPLARDSSTRGTSQVYHSTVATDIDPSAWSRPP